ncbi:MAG: phytoene/squalene synthase family protein [Chthoniobacterales bacterium]
MSALVPPAVAIELEAGRKASNLAFALRVLPAQRRHDALVFYKFCRTLDDIADSPNISATERSDALDAWERALDAPGTAPADLEQIIARHQIDRSLLREILAGVRTDLTVHRYTTFEDVRKYCWRVASAVGLASIRIFGCVRPESEAYAENLGLALQWTNILRDIGEDAANGRIYLPTEDLARFNVSETDLLAAKTPTGFLPLMEFEAARAREFFAASAASLHPDDRRALLPAELMRTIYSKLLDRMQRDGFRVFAKRYHLARIEKAFLALRMILAR